MDPLGLAKEIFSLVRIVYWGVALVLICVALTKPKNRVAKVAWAGAVFAVFASPPFFAEDDVKRINTAFKDSCSQVQFSIEPVASGSSQFVDMITCPWVGGIPGAFERGGTSQPQKIPSLPRHKVRA
jgi:hypothetical protein